MNTLILFSIILGGVWYVARPLFRKQTASQGGDRIDGRLGDLYTQRDNILKAIKDIEFDRLMGKISEEDFTEMSSTYRRAGLSLLRDIDSQGGGYDGSESGYEESKTLREQHQEGAARFCSACGASAGIQDRFCGQCGAHLNHQSPSV